MMIEGLTRVPVNTTTNTLNYKPRNRDFKYHQCPADNSRGESVDRGDKQEGQSNQRNFKR